MIVRRESMADMMKFSVPGKPQYVSTVRMAISCLANSLGFDVEAIEDIKIAVSEACTNVVCHGTIGNGEYEVCCELREDRLVISVVDKAGGYDTETHREPCLECPKEGGLGLYIIKALMDEVEIVTEMGIGTRIEMVKYTR
jgi:serine/threonine-protein kinase RsbW